MPLNRDFIKYLLKRSNKAPEPVPFLILANVKMGMSLMMDAESGVGGGEPSRQDQVEMGLVHVSVTQVQSGSF